MERRLEPGASRSSSSSGATATDLAGIPHVYDYTKTLEDRQVFDLIFGLQTIGRPFTAPPGIPAERAAALRSAFMAMTKDERFWRRRKNCRSTFRRRRADRCRSS
jgi:hypothetical protein